MASGVENLQGIVTPRGDILTVSRNPPQWVDYNPGDSYMVSLGIDTPPPTADRVLSQASPNGSRDAQHIAEAILKSKAIPKENSTALDGQDACTIDNVQSVFTRQAQKVQSPNGLFVFVYSGPVVKLEEGGWSLTPCGFDMKDQRTHVTADRLLQWLSNTQVKQALFVLDCSYADELADKLLSLLPKRDIHKCHVLSACSSAVPPCVAVTLGHSFFSHFSALAFTSTPFTPGHLPLSDLFERIRVPCIALSFLLVTYDPNKEELRPMEVRPGLRSRQILGRVKLILNIDGGDDEVDADVGRFEFVTKCYDRSKGKSIPAVSNKIQAWIETIQESPNGPLAQLKEQDLLNGEVLFTAVCSVLYSAVSTQAALEKESLSKPNFLIFLFLTTMATVEMYADEISAESLLRAWKFYHQAIVDSGVQDRKVTELFELAINNHSSTGTQGAD